MRRIDPAAGARARADLAAGAASRWAGRRARAGRRCQIQFWWPEIVLQYEYSRTRTATSTSTSRVRVEYEYEYDCTSTSTSTSEYEYESRVSTSTSIRSTSTTTLHSPLIRGRSIP